MPAAPTTAGSGRPLRSQLAEASDLRSKVCIVALTEFMSGTVMMTRRVARCSGRGQKPALASGGEDGDESCSAES